MKLIHVCKNLSLALDCRHKQISSVNIYINIHIYFNFGCSLCDYFSMFFEIILLHYTSVCMTSKVCFRSLKSYFRLEILMFLSFVVSFLVDVFN